MRRKTPSSSGSLTARSSSGRPSAFRNLAVHFSPSAALIPWSSPLERPSEKAKTVERSIPMTTGLRSSTTATRACHCSSPHSSACLAGPPETGFVERRAS